MSTVMAVTHMRYEQFFIKLQIMVPIGMMVSGAFPPSRFRFESSRVFCALGKDYARLIMETASFIMLMLCVYFTEVYPSTIEVLMIFDLIRSLSFI
jgi:hypothetical protein